MAIQTKSLSAAEHDWYATRSGLVTQAPLSEHKAQYFSDKGFGGNASIHKPLAQMEDEWLNSLTGVTGSHSIADKWIEAVAGAGLTPSVSMQENKLIFYGQVTASP